MQNVKHHEESEQEMDEIFILVDNVDGQFDSCLIGISNLI